MEQFLGTVSAAIAIFAGTNVDDVVVLTILFVSSRTAGRPTAGSIVGGQYLGIGVLVAASMVGAVGLGVVSDRWVGLAGVVPVAIGVWGLLRVRRAVRSGVEVSPSVSSGALAVAGVTVSNGADNIVAYTPTFRVVGVERSMLMIAVFVLLVAVWCRLGVWLSGHSRVIGVARRIGPALLPGVFVAIGVFVIMTSGVLAGTA